jgi:hypothetical protein
MIAEETGVKPTAETHVCVGMFRPLLADLKTKFGNGREIYSYTCPVCGHQFYYDPIPNRLHECWTAGHFDEPVYKKA